MKTTIAGWIVGFSVAGLMLGACSDAAAPATAPGSNDQCMAPVKAAQEHLGKVIEENRSCESDTDCVTIGFGASCFDSCARAVNQVGKGAYDRELTLVEASDCKLFHDDGCKTISPPCSPPNPPKCVQKLCQ